MVGRLGRKASADPLAVTRAMLEGALHKANDAVQADRMQDWDYAMQSYGDSCALLDRCMERTNQRDEEGALHWQIMDGIVRLSTPSIPNEGERRTSPAVSLGENFPTATVQKSRPETSLLPLPPSLFSFSIPFFDCSTASPRHSVTQE